MVIVFEDGIYNVGNIIYIIFEYIMVKFVIGNFYDVVFKGLGMVKGGCVKGIFCINVNYFMLDGVIFIDVFNYLV